MLQACNFVIRAEAMNMCGYSWTSYFSGWYNFYKCLNMHDHGVIHLKNWSECNSKTYFLPTLKVFGAQSHR